MQPIIICIVAFEEDDAAIERHQIKYDGKTGAAVVRVYRCDALPSARFAIVSSFDNVGDEDGI